MTAPSSENNRVGFRAAPVKEKLTCQVCKLCCEQQKQGALLPEAFHPASPVKYLPAALLAFQNSICTSVASARSSAGSGGQGLCTLSQIQSTQLLYPHIGRGTGTEGEQRTDTA